MNQFLSKRRLLALVLASLMVFAACGGGSSDAVDNSADDAAAAAEALVNQEDSPEEAMKDNDEAMDDDSDDAMEEEAMNDESEDAMEDDAMEDEDDAMEDEDVDAMMASGPGLHFDVSNFPTLASGVHYEGWAVIDGAPVSTGKFNVVEGKTVSLDGDEITGFHIEEDLAAATTIIVTIEPEGDTDAIPSDTHFVAGDVDSEGKSVLAIDHPAALGTDFSDSAGGFILATPSNGDETDEFSGVWFLDPSGPSASLTLPTLPAGWTYEGWAVIDGTPVSTGTFLSVEGADSGEPFKVEGDTPPFPGEDFLRNAPDGLTFPTDLRELPIVISVEPSPDGAPTPFVLKPLVGMAPGDAAHHVLYELGLNTDDLPKAEIWIG